MDYPIGSIIQPCGTSGYSYLPGLANLTLQMQQVHSWICSDWFEFIDTQLFAWYFYDRVLERWWTPWLRTIVGDIDKLHTGIKYTQAELHDVLKDYNKAWQKNVKHCTENFDTRVTLTGQIPNWQQIKQRITLPQCPWIGQSDGVSFVVSPRYKK